MSVPRLLRLRAGHHTDYIELKLLKKWQVPEEQFDPSFCPPESRK